ncbi:peptidoglycan-N-acetylglucosamine deacetylase [Paenibacillus sp. 79R4]|uniref:polysaccharide deacetylase family protein n=1 Tax=Paenibacillus sp. 79R4 TaxID=2212847 RepID=UPI0015BF400B|nr:polysaccharide deacetylase family protein [Paenibacillus sp. 79R4]NWL88068.1 peptidoglycan-N-acetylglucosamine deacetylase [Paenibacillus sp. 79R4]
MTARTNLDRGWRERKKRAKQRRRQIVMFAAIGLFGLALLRWILPLNTASIAEQQGEQPVYQQLASKVSKADPIDGEARPEGKIVYLTFDDGPSEWTGKFLDVLKEHGVQATFFMQGSNLRHKDLQSTVKRAVDEGHYIGGHSMTHQYKKLYEEGQFVSEMKDNLALIHEITGTHPLLVRAPYGSVPGLDDTGLRDQIAREGMKIWDWTIESNDWKLKDHPEQIVENIKKATKVDLEVVLMHEKLQTLQVLPEIIEFYKEEGYRFRVYGDHQHFPMNFQKDHRL